MSAEKPNELQSQFGLTKLSQRYVNFRLAAFST